MREFSVTAFFIWIILTAAGVHAQTLGNYADIAVYAGGNTTLAPSAAPTATGETTAWTSTNFKGVLTVNPATGTVRITNAQPAGIYTVTVKAFGANPATKTFTLRVLRQGCVNFNASGNFTPAPGSPFATGSEPRHSSIADFDNNGTQDILVPSGISANTALLSGSGNGGFISSLFTNNASNSNGSAAGDFDGDGDTDAVTNTVGGSVGGLTLLTNNGGAMTVSRIDLGSFLGTPNLSAGIAVGDFNNDGRADIAVSVGNVNIMIGVGNYHGVRILYGNGNMTFTIGPLIQIYGASLVRGDFDNNNIQDLAILYPATGIGTDTNSRITLAYGNGAGGFFIPDFPISIGNSSPRTLTLADFTNDGNQDLLVDSYELPQVKVLTNEGLGNFAVSTVSVGIIQDGCAAVDFNGDGNQDLAISQKGANLVRHFFGGGGGSFVTFGANSITDFTTRPQKISVGDFDQNGFFDLAISDNGSGGVGYGLASRLYNCPARITTLGPNLPDATQGTPYNTTVTADSVAGNFTFVASGLPMGLTMDFNGQILGIPTVNGTFIVDVTAFDDSPTANETTKQFLLQVNLPPTAASVSVGGRVFTPDGRGLRNARVILTDASGNSRHTISSSFGYYRFDEVEVGQTYIIQVISKQYQFQPQIVTVFDDMDELNFAAVSNLKR